MRSVDAVPEALAECQHARPSIYERRQVEWGEESPQVGSSSMAQQREMFGLPLLTNGTRSHSRAQSGDSVRLALLAACLRSDDEAS